MTSDTYFDPNMPFQVNEKGHLPHWYQPGKMQSMTIHLCDSLPQCKLDELEAEKKLWLDNHPQPWSEDSKMEYYRCFTSRVDKWLDNGHGDCLLKSMPVARALESVLLENHLTRYFLHTYVIMPNHCHFLITPNEEYTMEFIIGSIMGDSTLRINRMLSRSGKIWFKEGFDKAIRNEEHERKVRNYIIRNWTRGGIIFDVLG